MHRMSSYDIRRSIYFSKMGITLGLVSLFEAVLLQFQIKDQNLRFYMIVDRMALCLIITKTIIWMVFKWPSLIMIEFQCFNEFLHTIRKIEA